MALNLIDINYSSPTVVTRELYTNVGALDFQLGTYRRAFKGSTDLEIWDSAVGGAQLTEGIDYVITGQDLFFSNDAGFAIYSTVQVINVTYQTGNIYITYQAVGTYEEKTIFDDLDTRIAALEAASAGFRNRATIANGGRWYEEVWVSNTEMALKPKTLNGQTWMGQILSDGTYIEDTTSSALTRTLDATTLDGIGAVQNNSWYWSCVFKNSSNEFDWDFMFMPSTTISVSNPTNDISLTQINGQDIRSLYPVGANVAIWESTTKFETQDYDTTGATYTPASPDMKVLSYQAANQVRLTASLTVANFTSPTAICYLVDGFQPIDCTTEAIAAVISSRGWADSGVRLRTDGSGDIINFVIENGEFMYDNGSGAAEYIIQAGTGWGIFPLTTLYVNYFLSYSPPDKKPLIAFFQGNNYVSCKRYYQSYGQTVWYSNSGVNITRLSMPKHSIATLKTNGGTGQTGVMGYQI